MHDAASLLLTPRTVSLTGLSRTTPETAATSIESVVHLAVDSAVTNGVSTVHPDSNHHRIAAGKMTAEEASACGENNALFSGVGVPAPINLGALMGALQQGGLLGPTRTAGSTVFEAISPSNEYQCESPLDESGLCHVV